MKSLLLLFSILFLVNAFSFAQIPSKISLIVIQCKVNDSECGEDQIVRHKFENGEYVGKEVILKTMPSEITFEDTGNFIYRNRYILNRFGAIIDIQDGKVLHQDEGKLFRVSNDNIFFLNRDFRKPEVTLFNLENEESSIYRKIDRKLLTWNETISPDGMKSVKYGDGDEEDDNAGITIKRAGKSDLPVKEHFFSLVVARDLASATMQSHPFYWLDNDRILTPKFNGELVIVHTNGQVSPFMKIKINEIPTRNTKLYNELDSKYVYYECGEETYKIDIKNKSYETVTNSRDGFSFENKKNEPTLWKHYSYDGKKIGMVKSDWYFVSANGYIATPYLTKSEYTGGYYDGSKYWWDEDGVIVWNAMKRKTHSKIALQKRAIS